MPKDLTLSSSGMISGTLKKAGKKTFTVKAENDYGSDTRILTLYGYKYPEITTTALKEAVAGKSYRASIGLLSGTPTEECSNNKITITASNMGGDTQKIYYLTVKGVAPKIATKSLPDGTVGSAYSAVIEATGSSPLTWSAEGLPAGLSLSNGTISGTPTTAGKFK